MRSPGAAFDLRAAMAHELRAALGELNAGVEPSVLHRCRVRLKRARALARVGALTAPGLAAIFNESARSVMRMLAPVHDLSALADTARLLAETANERDAEALVATADNLDAARGGLPALDIAAARAGVIDLIALAQVWPAPSARQLRAGAKRIAKRARRLRRRNRHAKRPRLRHRWRKREKDRLYAATLMEDTWPGRRRRKHGEALGHVLGLERDARLLMKRLLAQPALAGDEAQARRARRALRSYRERLHARADMLRVQLHAAGA